MLAVWLELRVDKDFESVKAKADAGDARTQFNLGERYAEGEGVPKDKNEAVEWYYKAAEQGLADAQFCLGKCYEEAVKVEGHVEQAVKWFRKAAEQGHAEAQFHLGRIYTKRGRRYNRAGAAEWLCRAAEQGNPEHQLYFWNYLKGCMRVPPEIMKAEQWFRKAAAQGNEEAQFHLAIAYERDWKEATKMLRKLAAQGFTIAHFFIEAEEGHAAAQFERGLCYYNGKLVYVNYSEALKWFRLAAKQKHGWACTKLAEMYEDGDGVRRSSKQSAMWRNRADRYLPYPRPTLAWAGSERAEQLGTSSWLVRHKQS